MSLLHLSTPKGPHGFDTWTSILIFTTCDKISTLVNKLTHVQKRLLLSFNDWIIVWRSRARENMVQVTIFYILFLICNHCWFGCFGSFVVQHIVWRSICTLSTLFEALYLWVFTNQAFIDLYLWLLAMARGRDDFIQY